MFFENEISFYTYMCMYVCVCVYETNIIFRGFNFISTGDDKTKKKKKMSTYFRFYREFQATANEA